MKLLPCPFCGGTPESDHARGFMDYKGRPGNAAAIYCTDCEADMTLCHDDFPGDTPEHLLLILADQWNKRATNDPTENGRLRIALGEVFRLIDDGWLVRNTDGDGKCDWALRQVQAVQRLASAQRTLEMAKETKP